MTKEYLITNSRFKLVVVIMVVMWLIIIGFFYMKADEVTKDPCQICAERHGKNVRCTTTSLIPVTRTYYTNGSIVDTDVNIKRGLPKVKDLTKDFEYLIPENKTNVNKTVFD